MVSFVCNSCGNTVKKNQVEKHYQTQCRNCSVLSCIDCGVDFHGDSYATHNSCISEAEKYQGHLYQASNKENKGENKQKEWIKQVQIATESVVNPKLKSLLQRVSEYSNVPRKEKKFQNFCKNSLRIYDELTLSQLWDAFSGATVKESKTLQENHHVQADPDKNLASVLKDKKKEISVDKKTETISEEKNRDKVRKRKRAHENDVEINENGGEQKGKKKKVYNIDENTDKNSKSNAKKNKKEKKQKKVSKEIIDETAKIIPQQTETLSDENTEKLEKKTGKFHWHKAIKQVLKESNNNELSIKKLRKKVLCAYLEHGCDHKATTIEECRSMFDKKLKTYPKVKIAKENVKLIK
ncbi:cell growth-regulating nucleolar protein isoform X1 [Hydra vulgaris]|uniref:cell growth-regulating nucleolar protein isoform X1 n=1 Tax=Hydra vulgaris TaxID=6087 RepID=UPI001F5FB4FD|nr:cell growth-regulating nucleolar protein [Hydra vulgaris]